MSERRGEDLGPGSAGRAVDGRVPRADGRPGQPWTSAANRDIVLTTIDLFGPARCMFASNFPVDSICASFHTIFGGFREIVRDFSVGEQRGLFHDNAIRIYGMER